jgi:hypothetical protein
LLAAKKKPRLLPPHPLLLLPRRRLLTPLLHPLHLLQTPLLHLPLHPLPSNLAQLAMKATFGWLFSWPAQDQTSNQSDPSI